LHNADPRFGESDSGLSLPTLVVVSCGRTKIWDRQPGRGAVPASEAYTGAPFVLNRRYAERFGSDWAILSAKHGFVRLDLSIPGPYEVSFTRPKTNPIGVGRLRKQVRELGLDRFALVVGLGGKAYRAAIEAAFAGTGLRLAFPFAGLQIGKSMQAAKRVIVTGAPGFQVG
jgi:hypothetical protein